MHFLSTSTKMIFIQQKYLFNNTDNYSASTMHCEFITYPFLWQKFWKLPDIQIIVIHKIPLPVLTQMPGEIDFVIIRLADRAEL